MKADDSSRFLIETVLHELATDAEALLLLAHALEDRVSATTANARPQQLREAAALFKSTALQLVQVAANMVGSAECLRLVAEFHELADPAGGDLPS